MLAASVFRDIMHCMSTNQAEHGNDPGPGASLLGVLAHNLGRVVVLVNRDYRNSNDLFSREPLAVAENLIQFKLLEIARHVFFSSAFRVLGLEGVGADEKFPVSFRLQTSIKRFDASPWYDEDFEVGLRSCDCGDERVHGPGVETGMLYIRTIDSILHAQEESEPPPEESDG